MVILELLGVGVAFPPPPPSVHRSFGTPGRGGGSHVPRQGSWGFGSENYVNGQEGPSVYGNSSQGSSLGDLSSLGGFSNLSIGTGGTKQEDDTLKKQNLDEAIFVPEVVEKVFLNKHEYTNVVKECSEDSSIALRKCREMLGLLQTHKGLKETQAKVEAQEEIYRVEEQASTNGIKEIDRRIAAEDTAFEKEMANLKEHEEEALRLEKKRHEQACQDIKDQHKEDEVQRSREKSQREEELRSKRNEFQQQRVQTQNEKFTNLTLAKAHLMAWETGVELFNLYADAHTKKGDPTVLSDIKNNHEKLGKLQDHITNKATNALKRFIWGSDVVVD